MIIKKLGTITFSILVVSFMGILMCVGLLFSEGSGDSESTGGISVSEEVFEASFTCREVR